MREIHLEELKAIQLEILDAVMAFCDEHDINCWLNGGTLLGAIRHKGYIPWDDDVDLGMLRPDYEKFKKLFNEHNTRFKLIDFDNAPESMLYFAKVIDTSTVLYEPNEKGLKLAVYVDIFMMDNAPDDEKILRKMFKTRDICYVCNLGRKLPIFLKPTRGGFLRSLVVYAFRAVLRVFPKYYFCRKIIENSKRYMSQDTSKAGDFTGLHNAVMDKQKFNDVIYWEFEGKQYKIPSGYDEWLSKLYGDYMQLPPEDKRESTHKFKAYKL